VRALFITLAPLHTLACIVRSTLIGALCLAAARPQAWAQAPGSVPARVLTNAAQLRALSPEEAARRLPVRSRGVVTALNPKTSVFFQDDTGGAFITHIPATLHDLAPGDELLVEGVTHVGLFLPGILPGKVVKLGHGELPPPRHVNYDDLLSGRYHYERVEVSGIVRSFRWQASRACPLLTLALGARKLEAELVVAGRTNLPPLVDAQIRVAGLAAGYINSRRQLLAPQLLVSRLEDLHVEIPPPAEPYKGPLISTADLLTFTPQGASGHRVHVRGVVTYQRLGEALFLRDAADGLMVRTPQNTKAQAGDVVEAVGFPAMGRFSPFLEDAEFRVVRRELPPQPIPTSLKEILQGTNDANLVTLEGKILEVIPTPTESVLVVESGKSAFRARLPRKPLPLRNGTNVRLTGVCHIAEAAQDETSRFRANVLDIELLLRSAEDIAIIAKPSGWTPQRFATVAGLLVGVALTACIWVVVLRRRVTEQARVIRQKVQREVVLEERQRMAREMHDTLAQSFSGVGFQLDALKSRLPADAELARTQLEVARQMVRHGQEDFRRTLMNLRAQELERGSLTEVLPKLAKQITDDTGITLKYQVHGTRRGLPEVIENNLLRIGQECLTNAVRHARASEIALTLDFEPGLVRLRVADNGIGCHPQDLEPSPNGHFGWRGIRERAEQIRAKAELDSHPGQGTRVTVTVPI
jgi:signal transduction histidine kinase